MAKRLCRLRRLLTAQQAKQIGWALNRLNRLKIDFTKPKAEILPSPQLAVPKLRLLARFWRYCAGCLQRFLPLRRPLTANPSRVG
jgi:hypothetical protein